MADSWSGSDDLTRESEPCNDSNISDDPYWSWWIWTQLVVIPKPSLLLKYPLNIYISKHLLSPSSRMQNEMFTPSFPVFDLRSHPSFRLYSPCHIPCENCHAQVNWSSPLKVLMCCGQVVFLLPTPTPTPPLAPLISMRKETFSYLSG